MKKVIILFLYLLWGLSAATAQSQDPWVGTWTSESWSDMDWENSPKDSDGTYSEIIKTDYKLVIRITKHGDQYNVRAKTIKVKDPSYSSYHKPLTITKMTDNCMWLESCVNKDPFTVDYGNGTFIESYSDNTAFFKLSLNSGILHYSFYKIYSKEYDKNMRYKGEETYNTLDAPGHNLDLFNDDW